MPHAIAKHWSSKVNGTAEDGFDLRNLNEQGSNVTDCTHGAVPIHGGSVTEINRAVYLVKFNEPPDGNYQMQYRGVAMLSLDGEFHHIVGIKKKVLLAQTERKAKTASEGKTGLNGQDEGTWTGQQP